jgi:hypothetical protein
MRPSGWLADQAGWLGPVDLVLAEGVDLVDHQVAAIQQRGAQRAS